MANLRLAQWACALCHRSFSNGKRKSPFKLKGSCACASAPNKPRKRPSLLKIRAAPASIRNIVRAAPATYGEICFFECLMSRVVGVFIESILIFEFNHKSIREWVSL